MNQKDLNALEARILRSVADAMRDNYEYAYHSRGGPQDGDSTPSSFNGERAAKQLEEEADKVENGEPS